MDDDATYIHTSLHTLETKEEKRASINSMLNVFDAVEFFAKWKSGQ